MALAPNVAVGPPKLFALWSYLIHSHPAVPRPAHLNKPPVSQSDIWSNYCTRLQQCDLAASDVWLLNGRGYFVDLRVVVVLPVYQNLLFDLVKSPLLPSNDRTLVIGQPGTGKSCLIPVYMRVLMALRRPFIYSVGGSTDCAFFYWEFVNGNNHCGKIENTSPAFQDPSVTWLMDQMAHGPWDNIACHCKFVLITSENRNQYKRFTYTAHVNVVNMPLPTEEDCAAVAAAYNVDPAVATARRERYGPILRLILHGHNLSPEQDLNDALVRCTFTGCVNSLNIFVDGGEFSHHIFYFDADQAFVQLPRKFGSKYIQDRYYQIWFQNKRHDFMKFLRDVNPELAAVQDPAFTLYAHGKLIKAARNRKARMLHPRLSNNDIRTDAEIRPRRLVKVEGFEHDRAVAVLENSTTDFTSVAAAAAGVADGVYLKSRTTNMDAVDALVLNPKRDHRYAADLFQMTVSLRHDVNCDKLAALIDRIDSYRNYNNTSQAPGIIRLFIVVPEATAGQFARQTYTGLRQSVLTPQMLNRIEMYSLGIELCDD